jgi:hypothetical protein
MKDRKVSMGKTAGIVIGVLTAIGLGFVVTRMAKGAGGTTVHGTVTDAATMQPIAGADVRITDFGVPPSGHYSIDKSTKTDSQGKYSFTVNLASIYVPPDWVGEGRGVKVSAIAFHYSGGGTNAIILAGENEVNIQLLGA